MELNILAFGDLGKPDASNAAARCGCPLAVYSISRMIRILGTIFAGLLGLVFGSFLNVCLSRWPQGESIVTPRSHCRQCGRTLAWWENIPLASWLALRGRCRTCRAWIGWRYPLVELAVGALWASSAWSFFDSIVNSEFPSYFVYHSLEITLGEMIFYWLVIALAVLDFENLWLPDSITLAGSALGFIFVSFAPVLRNLVPKELHKFSIGFEIELGAFSDFRGILVAAGLILLIRWLYWLIRRREGIGLGDAKLMALLAAWLGLPGALLAFGLGVVTGALVAVVLLAMPAARSETSGWAHKKLPLGTFLCVGGIVSSLWGQPIIAAYRQWAGF
jgi:leader peptidase (prepilin peptidase)/N-methyltransferase